MKPFRPFILGLKSHLYPWQTHLWRLIFFMVLHLIISDSSNHPMIIWRNGQMCQLAIVWRSREYMYLWVTLDIVSILGLATVCGLVGCWGDNVTRWSRATGAPQTTRSGGLSVLPWTPQRADAKAILRDLCYMKYRRKSIYCKSQRKYWWNLYDNV